MVYSARTLALLLAVTIALVTVLFLSLVQGTDRVALVVAAIISFSASYLLIFVVLEFLIFREINKIYKMMGKLRKKELSGISNEKSGALNPLQNINEEIYSFATLKQKEIDELRKLEAFRKEFIADVSHELKTPIFAAQGFVHTLLDGAVNDKNVRNKFLKKAPKGLNVLKRWGQACSSLSQFETEVFKFNLVTTDWFNLAMEEVVKLEERAE